MTAFSDQHIPFYFMPGVTKSATTWLWKVFLEHPEICTSHQLDRINYFSLHYQKGIDWYKEHFDFQSSNQIYLDPTPEYIKDPFVPERISRFRHDARFIFTLRNPIDRALSLWWHQKRKRRINYNFDDLFLRKHIGSFVLYDEWILSGFYMHWINRFLEFFPSENIKIVLFDDLQANPRAYAKEVFEFLQVDTNFQPSIIDVPQNVSGEKGKSKGVRHILKDMLDGRNNREFTLSNEMRHELQQIFKPHNDKLGQFLDRDLSHWK
ncbi:MAG: sulfotransferase domain-containing protein [Cytophagales bacterium]|nr:sulfotransferase domain-containing protein [Cytophagales bacterium]